MENLQRSLGNDNGHLYVWDANNLDELYRNESSHKGAIHDMQVKNSLLPFYYQLFYHNIHLIFEDYNSLFNFCSFFIPKKLKTRFSSALKRSNTFGDGL